MPTIGKSPALGAALLVGIVIAANADPLSRPVLRRQARPSMGWAVPARLVRPSRQATRSRLFRRPMRRRSQTAQHCQMLPF
jgi:hypothetical protein